VIQRLIRWSNSLDVAHPTVFYSLLTGLVVVHMGALEVPVMEVDAAQYASISMEMLQKSQWLEVQHQHLDYLDKPPLLFWLSALSLHLFGLQTWAYKLPSLLGLYIGLWATYRFCKLFYAESEARLAVLILGSTVGFMLLTNDVRTDSLLLGFTTAAVWQVAAYQLFRKWQNLIWAGIFVGLAMLTKGPLGFILPLAALGTHVLVNGYWKEIKEWRWWLIPLIALVVLSPMCWGLWQQYDLHPEKVVNGRTGVSGLYFFFWEQSFGRITGENVWENDTSFFTFFHVYLWAFLPWIVLLLCASFMITLKCFDHTKARISNISTKNTLQEGYSLGAFFWIFLALSFSHYKLPHYIFITLPWAAIITGGSRGAMLSHYTGSIKWLHWIIVILSVSIALSLVIWVFPTQQVLFWIIAAPVLLSGLWLSSPWSNGDSRVVGTVLAAIFIGIVLHFAYYPQLLRWQSTSEAGLWLRAHNKPTNEVMCMGKWGHALDFYAGGIIPHIYAPREACFLAERIQKPVWVYVDQKAKDNFDFDSEPYRVIAEWDHYQVALMSGAFLNPATRMSATRKVYLVEVLP
jgi:4-amino-4-deoxy-L-arabinose transferase-like glycosyltransferase